MLLSRKPQSILSEDVLPIENAEAVIKVFGKERYLNLDDDKLRLLYRAFEAKYREHPEEKFANRLWEISEVINIRAKEKAEKEYKKPHMR